MVQLEHGLAWRVECDLQDDGKVYGMSGLCAYLVDDDVHLHKISIQSG